MILIYGLEFPPEVVPSSSTDVISSLYQLFLKLTARRVYVGVVQRHFISAFITKVPCMHLFPHPCRQADGICIPIGIDSYAQFLQSHRMLLTQSLIFALFTCFEQITYRVISKAWFLGREAGPSAKQSFSQS